MMIILNHTVGEQQVQALIDAMHERGIVLSRSEEPYVLRTEDDDSTTAELLAAAPFVCAVCKTSEATPLYARTAATKDTCVRVGAACVGAGNWTLIAGPCAIEDGESLLQTAAAVKKAGANILRGGAFKPRTSPYDFQGLGKCGVELLVQVGRAVGLPVVTEIVDVRDLEYFSEVDLLQVGARNMQNYTLLKELGRSKKPVLLKRGMGSTLRELLLSAEYLLGEGNSQVILCERGIRSFETAVRYTLDLSAVPLLHELSHLPVIVDPSHAVGQARLVPPMAAAAAACGADGVMLEVHSNPFAAKCDATQAILPEEFATLAEHLRTLREVVAG